MKNKTLQQWLEEMDKLDWEASRGPWHTKPDYEDFIYAPDNVTIGQVFLSNPAQTKDTALVLSSRTELPRAVKIIKTILDRFIDFELEAAVQEEIEKIINGE